MTTDLEHNLVHPNNIFKSCRTLLKSFTDTMHIGHVLKIVLLQLTSVFPMHELIMSLAFTWMLRFEDASSTNNSTRSCLFTVADKLSLLLIIPRQENAPISCRLTNGCLSQLPNNLVPWAVLHLFNSPCSVVFLLDPPMFPGASVRLSARSALASSFMYCDRSCVRIAYAPWFDGSATSERYVHNAARAAGAIGSASWAICISMRVVFSFQPRIPSHEDETENLRIAMEASTEAEVVATEASGAKRRTMSSSMDRVLNSPGWSHVNYYNDSVPKLKAPTWFSLRNDYPTPLQN